MSNEEISYFCVSQVLLLWPNRVVSSALIICIIIFIIIVWNEIVPRKYSLCINSSIFNDSITQDNEINSLYLECVLNKSFTNWNHILNSSNTSETIRTNGMHCGLDLLNQQSSWKENTQSKRMKHRGKGMAEIPNKSAD